MKPDLDDIMLLMKNAERCEIDLNSKDVDGKTGFIWACHHNHLELIRLFMKKAKRCKIDINAKDVNGQTGLMWLCKEDWFKWRGETQEWKLELESRIRLAIKLFMENADSFEIDLHYRDNDGKTGFDYIPEHLLKSNATTDSQSRRNTQHFVRYRPYHFLSKDVSIIQKYRTPTKID